MAKTPKTVEMERRLNSHISKQGTFHCPEVTMGWFGKERVDWLSYDTTKTFRCFEIKVSKRDFYSDCHNTFVGHYNYYVMPKELYEIVKEDVPKHIGVLVENEYPFDYMWGSPLSSIKKAKKQPLQLDEEDVKDYLIRSLYRESSKYRKDKDLKRQNKNLKANLARVKKLLTLCRERAK